MKRWVVLSLLLTVFVTSCTSIDKEVFIKNKKPLTKENVRVAVLNFKDARKHPGSGREVAEAMTNEIIKIPHWQAIERSQISRVLGEKALDASGLTNRDFRRFKKLFSADFLIVGSVNEYSYERKLWVVPKTKLQFNARIIDVKSGLILGTATYTLESGKHAWIGCCFLGWYYVPVALFTDENINRDVRKAAKELVKDLSKQVKRKKKYCFF